jgi:hypothetical protein
MYSAFTVAVRWTCHFETRILGENTWSLHVNRIRNQPGLLLDTYTVRSQKNDAFLKVNKKYISHLTRVKHTPSAAATVHVLMRYQQFASHAYYGAAGLVSKMASQQEKAFCTHSI